MDSPGGPGAGYAARVAGYGDVSTALALRSDEQLRALVAQAPSIGSGIGGASARLAVEGRPVFVKRVPLTDLERRPEHVMSTANLFRLPSFFQYGVGSAGFGAWRELAAHVMTTNWVLGRRCGSFPLLYHWRVLAGAPAVPPELADPRMVAYWGGSAVVRERLAALAGASASLVLFLEHLPQNLSEWLAGEAAGGPDRVAAACSMVERELRTAVAFMNSNGLLHFDAHFRNVLTDGRRLYLADLGLASSPRFALADDERAFLRNHLTYDRCQTVTELVNWLVTALPGSVPPAAERDELIRRYADGANPGADVPPPAAAVIRRYAPIVATMNGFYLRLHLESRATPYPADQLRRLCAAIGVAPG